MAEPFRHRLRVRWGECDPQGIVFNANYLLYLDTAMTEFWRGALAPYPELVARGIDFVMVESRIGYRAPARFDEEVDVRLSVGRTGRSSARFDARIEREGELLIEGELHYVCIVPGGEIRSQELPPDVRAALERYASES
jgi:acyl-CoA thioester hydrolase